jgi:hypothetical protein
MRLAFAHARASDTLFALARAHSCCYYFDFEYLTIYGY